MTPRIIAVDWSGAKTGAARKIALAEARDGELISVETNLTRCDVISRLIEYRRTGDVIAGLDFGFSMPAWYLRQQGFMRAHDCWRWLAEGACADDLLRECQTPFWGRKGHRRPSLERHFRRTEESLQATQHAPKSVFQIAGAGSVGTGSVRGMRALHEMSAAGFAVWPFDDPAPSLMLEIYPRLFYRRSVVKSDEVDRAAYIDDEDSVGNALKAAAAHSEDAFDAAISAIAMSRHVADLRALPPITDPTLRLEGIIWHPNWREMHAC